MIKGELVSNFTLQFKFNLQFDLLQYLWHYAYALAKEKNTFIDEN